MLMFTPNEVRILDDDWTRIDNPVERRRRQNRLHQRAWRRRKRFQITPEMDSPSNVSPVTPLNERDVLYELALQHVSGRQRMPVTLEQLQNWKGFGAKLETLGDSQATFAVWAELRAWRKWELIYDLPSSEKCNGLALDSLSLVRDISKLPVSAPAPNCDSFMILNQNYTLHGLEYEVDLPLSLDHKLFVLIQHNSLQGMLTNMAILMRLNGQDFRGWDSFYTEDLPIPPEIAPASLQFTQIQKAISHESWIDVIPWPSMRDNILKCQDEIDIDELCADLMGGFEQGMSDTKGRGVILWGDPWSGADWELSENFMRKWWFLLQDGSDIIEYTNQWRTARGEKKFAMKV